MMYIVYSLGKEEEKRDGGKKKEKEADTIQLSTKLSQKPLYPFPTLAPISV